MIDEDKAIEIIEKLYRPAGASDPAAFRDFAPDAQIYFPKFGVARGETGWRDFIEGLFSSISK